MVAASENRPHVDKTNQVVALSVHSLPNVDNEKVLAPSTQTEATEVSIIPVAPYPPEGGLRAWLTIAGA